MLIINIPAVRQVPQAALCSTENGEIRRKQAAFTVSDTAGTGRVGKGFISIQRI